MSLPPPCPNPRRVAAGRLNRRKCGPLSPAGRERLRQAALANRPWLASTGPRTPEGKSRAARNGKRRQKGGQSVREVRRSLAEVVGLVNDMAAGRKLVAELLEGGSPPPTRDYRSEVDLAWEDVPEVAAVDGDLHPAFPDSVESVMEITPEESFA